MILLCKCRRVMPTVEIVIKPMAEMRIVGSESARCRAAVNNVEKHQLRIRVHVDRPGFCPSSSAKSRTEPQRHPRWTKRGNVPAVFPDGVVVPVLATAATAAGKYRDVSILAGNMLEKGELFRALIDALKPTSAELFTMHYKFDLNAAPTLVESDFIRDTYLPVDSPGGGNDATPAVAATVFDDHAIACIGSLVAVDSSTLLDARWCADVTRDTSASSADTE